jgi:hypothetical protein
MAADSAGRFYFTAQNAVFRLDANGALVRIAGTGAPGFSGDGGSALTATFDSPLGVAVDSTNNIYIADSNNNRVRRVDPNGIVTTVAGGGSCCTIQSGVPAIGAYLNFPQAVAIDGTGNLFIAVGSIIQRVTAGTITTIAGTGVAGFAGDGGPATSAQLGFTIPGIVVNSAGTVYFADQANTRIRRILNGTISTVAGGAACCGFTENGAATSVFLSPVGLALGPTGDLFVAEAERVRRVNIGNGTIATFAGGGTGGEGSAPTSALLESLFSIAATPAGTIAIGAINRIRLIENNLVTTIAGGAIGDGLPAIFQPLTQARGIVRDSSGNFYIADPVHHRVRRIDANGVITTFAGTGVAGFSGDGGQAVNAQLNFPLALALDNTGALFIADNLNARIRRVDPNGVITTIAGGCTSGCSTNNGTNALQIPIFPSTVAVDSSGTVYLGGNARIGRITGGQFFNVAGTGSSGFSGDGGTATSAQIQTPLGLRIDPSGNLYFFDGGFRLRRVSSGGIISTVAGNGTAGTTGDGGQATAATISYGEGVAFDASGNIYLSHFGRVRVITTNGNIHTLAGGAAATSTTNGLSATADGVLATGAYLNFPVAIDIDSSNRVYITDYNDGNVRVLTPVSTSAVLTVTTTASGTLNRGSSASFVTEVRNAASAGSTSGTVTVVQYPPAGFTISTLSGSGWSCNTGTLTCTRGNSLAPGAAYPAITATYTVPFSAPSQVTYRATAGGGGSYVQGSNLLATVTPGAAMTSPAPGSTLTGSSVTFQWVAGGATEFGLWIGTTGVGSNNITSTGGTALSFNATGLPTNGQTVYVRLWSVVNGSWQFSDYTYTAATIGGGGTGPAVMTSPAPGSTLSGANVTFQWTAGGASQYGLWIGTTGVGSNNITSTGGASLSFNATGLPTNGQTLYVRLWSQVSGVWQSNDYTYTAATGGVAMTSPAPGSTLSGANVTFQWTAGGASEYGLWIGTTGAGSNNITSTGGTTLSFNATGLPTNGQTLYVRLWSQVSGVWQFSDYTYTAATGGVAMTSPAPGSTLTSSSVTFQWTAGGAAQYGLWIGTTGAGSNNITSTGGTTQSFSATGLPTNGETLYVRLWSQVSGVWQFTDYTYTAATIGQQGNGSAVMTSPAPGSTVSGSSVTFQWTAGSASQYGLWIGTTGAGSGNLVQTGGATTSFTANGLPSNGQPLYVRLWSQVNGAWLFNDYVYTAGDGSAVIVSPAPGSTLSGSSVTFQWTAGAASEYGLWIGTTGVGSGNVVQTGGTGTTFNATGLPTGGGTIYVRVWSLVAGSWRFNDYTYLTAP